MTDDLLTRMRSVASLGAALKCLDEGADRIIQLTDLLTAISQSESRGVDWKQKIEAALDQARKE